MNPKQALTKEQPKISPHISNDCIKVVDPILDSKDITNCTGKQVFLVSYLFSKLTSSIGKSE